MKLSIITINYNNRNGLQKTINSVVNQTFKDFEWIIIDGGSTDGSRELIEQYSPYVTYWISEPDKGIYNAMNKGIKVATGSYLLFLNSGDCLFDNDVLCNVHPYLKDKDFYIGDEQRTNYIYRLNISTTKKLFEQVFLWGIPHQSTFFHRRIFNKYGLYREDKNIISDWWIAFTAIILGNATYSRLPFIVSIYDESGISSHNDKLIKKERSELLSELPRINFLCDFYSKNYAIVEALRDNRLVFFIFRIYFFLYRKFKSK